MKKLFIAFMTFLFVTCPCLFAKKGDGVVKTNTPTNTPQEIIKPVAMELAQPAIMDADDDNARKHTKSLKLTKIPGGGDIEVDFD